MQADGGTHVANTQRGRLHPGHRHRVQGAHQQAHPAGAGRPRRLTSGRRTTARRARQVGSTAPFAQHGRSTAARSVDHEHGPGRAQRPGIRGATGHADAGHHRAPGGDHVPCRIARRTSSRGPVTPSCSAPASSRSGAGLACVTWLASTMRGGTVQGQGAPPTRRSGPAGWRWRWPTAMRARVRATQQLSREGQRTGRGVALPEQLPGTPVDQLRPDGPTVVARGVR